jgi:hypothetical protein
MAHSEPLLVSSTSEFLQSSWLMNRHFVLSASACQGHLKGLTLLYSVPRLFFDVNKACALSCQVSRVGLLAVCLLRRQV